MAKGELLENLQITEFGYDLGKEVDNEGHSKKATIKMDLEGDWGDLHKFLTYLLGKVTLTATSLTVSNGKKKDNMEEV